MGQAGMRFLGVGGSSGMELGSAAAVLEADGQPMMLIDCGLDIPQRYASRYPGPPPAVFITHVHMDHCSGLEPLFYSTWFRPGDSEPVRLFVPVDIVASLQARLVVERSPLAEGGVNFWDAFHLVPVSRGFYWQGHWFDVFPVRHHRPGFAFGLRLENAFLYTGDTRPIPDLMQHYAAGNETVFHDCRLDGNPSHSGWSELRREYPDDVLQRTYLYHYGTPREGILLRNQGARLAEADVTYELGTVNTPPIRSPEGGSRVA
jgi:hypothetical protein